VAVKSYDPSASAQLRRSHGILKIDLRIAAATPLRISEAEERRWRVHQVVPFVPTDAKIIRAALEMSAVGKNDVFVDIGCGDGRVCVAAALRGAHAIGYDCDAACISDAAIYAAEAGVAHSCSFVLSDFLTQRPLVPTGTSVVYLHLYPEIVEQLRPRLLEILDAGVRIITFAMSHLRGVRAARTAKAGQLELIDFSIRREFFDAPLKERLRFD
jgi:cyclopropane fatty-acyl-phospholipid synthase-like methyltransferase